MDDLIEFLRARLDEDQRTADAAAEESGVDWYYGNDAVRARREDDMIATGSQDILEPGYGKHIARHDPARVLADIEAKRRIIDDTWGGPDHEDMWLHHLRLLAAVYADHPDYREKWRP